MTQPRDMALREHLDELKKRLKVVAVAYMAALVFWLIVPVDLFDLNGLLTGLYRPFISVVLDNVAGLAAGRVTIIAGNLFSPLEIYFLASAIVALATVSPVIGYEIYKFVDPAFLPEERRTFYIFMTAFIGLFTGGVFLAYFVLVPATIRFTTFFASVVNAQPVITSSDYYGMVFLIIGATGISFTTPAVFVLLVELGVISTSVLTKNRLIGYAVLYIGIIVLTPEPVIGHIGIFLPMVVMMELAVIIGKRVEKNRTGSRAAATPEGQKGNCTYCGTPLEPGKRFCSKCGRAQT